jgi:hypothetical protein
MSIWSGPKPCQVSMGLGLVGDTGTLPGPVLTDLGPDMPGFRAMRGRVFVTEDISASPYVVYDLISDLTRMGEWSRESTGGRWLGGNGPGVGARFLGRNRSARRRWSTLVTVMAADPGRRFAFRVTAPLVPIADWEYTIEETGAGCRVRETWVDLRLAPVRLVSTIRTGIADRAEFNRRSMQETLEALKEAAEAGTGNAPVR